MIEKNKEELENERLCWLEIEESLRKYNCSLVGWGSAYDGEYDESYEVSAEQFGVNSNDFTIRLELFRKEEEKNKKEEYKRLTKEKYQELVDRFGKYKDLKLVMVGKTGDFWFDGLTVNYKKVNKDFFKWNPNGFWQMSNYYNSHHGVHINLNEHCTYSGLNGEPHFYSFYWERERGSVRYCEWFKFNKKVDWSVYQDMINICYLLDYLISFGVLTFK